MDLISSETPERRLPISEVNETASTPQAPKVSTTTGAKMYAGSGQHISLSYRPLVSLAADPAAIEKIDRCKGGHKGVSAGEFPRQTSS